jgi:hypothetical protein
MAKAYNTGDLRTANLFLETARRCLETQAKCLGQIETGTTVNLTVNDFRTLQVNIVAALAPFPEARAAVLRALGDDVPTIEG